MTYVQAILLGALQGITEFLPVSSSGHLLILQTWFGVQSVPLLFDVILHVASLGAVFVVFSEKIRDLLIGLYCIVRNKPFPRKEETILLIRALIVSTICTGIIGFPIKNYIKEIDIKFIFGFFIATALLLLWAGKRQGKRSFNEMSGVDSIVIGIAQGIGVLPGISRSGITISTGLLLGLDRKVAGEYSFLLAIPAILGALVLSLRDLSALQDQVSVGVMLAGFFTSFLTGLGALSLLVKIVRKSNLGWFALYLLPLGIVGLVFL